MDGWAALLLRRRRRRRRAVRTREPELLLSVRLISILGSNSTWSKLQPGGTQLRLEQGSTRANSNPVGLSSAWSKVTPEQTPNLENNKGIKWSCASVWYKTTFLYSVPLGQRLYIDCNLYKYETWVVVLDQLDSFHLPHTPLTLLIYVVISSKYIQ